jgi:hypothetical protein
MVDLFQKHVGPGVAGDLEATMDTMNADPHLNRVTTMAGGVGRDGVRDFKPDHLVGKILSAERVKMTNLSVYSGASRQWAEIVISSIYTTPI